MKNTIFFALIVTFVLYACQGERFPESRQDVSYDIKFDDDQANGSSLDYNSPKGNSPIKEESYNITEGDPYPDEANNVTADLKLIKECFLEMRVQDYANSLANIRKEVQHSGGYISSENEENRKYSIFNRIEIKVPSEKFDQLLENLEGIADTLDGRSRNVQDVSMEYFDLEAHLTSKIEVEKRLLKLLDQAKDMEDILNIERQLGITRSEIERMQGRKQYLDHRIGMSTITVDMIQYLGTPNYSKKKGVFEEIGDAFMDGLDILGDLSLGLLSIWPFVLFFALITWWLYRKIKRRFFSA